jgi:hypothetical protein
MEGRRDGPQPTPTTLPSSKGLGFPLRAEAVRRESLFGEVITTIGFGRKGWNLELNEI